MGAKMVKGGKGASVGNRQAHCQWYSPWLIMMTVGHESVVNLKISKLACCSVLVTKVNSFHPLSIKTYPQSDTTLEF